MAEVSQHVTDTITQVIVSKSPYVAGAATVIGGLTLNEWLTIMGLIFMPLTFALNWYMQWERNNILRKATEQGNQTGERDGRDEK